MTDPRSGAVQHSPPRPGCAVDVALGLLLALLTLALGLFFLRDPLGHDDRRMFVYAHYLLNGLRGAAQFAGTHYRTGFLLEHALAQIVWGYTATAYYAVALFNSMAVVVALFFTARVFFPRGPAVLVGLVFLSNPYFLSQSSWPQIDWPSAWRFLVGLSFAVLALRRSELRSATRYRCAVCAGLFFWWSFYTKASAAPLLLMVPTLVLFVPFDRRSWIAVGWIAVAAAVGVGLGLGLDYAFLGDPFACLRKVQEAHTFEFSQETYLDRGLIPLDLTWSDLALRYPRLYAAQAPGRIFLVAAGAGALIAIISRARPLLLFLAFALAYWAAVSLMVTSTDPLIPVLRTKDRYFAAGFGLLFLLSGGGAYVVFRWIHRRLPGPAFLRRAFTVASVAAVGLLVAYQLRFHATHPLGYHVEKVGVWSHERVFIDIAGAARRGVAGWPVERVITDGRMAEILNMFLPPAVPTVRFDPGGAHFAFQQRADFVPGSLVYFNYSRIANNERKYYDNQAPEFIRTVPGHWLEVFQRGKHAVFFVLDPDAIKTDVRASGWPLLQHLHVRRQVREGRTGRELSEPFVKFRLADVTDARIVLGKQHYARRPSPDIGDGALWIQEPGYLHVALVLRPRGDVRVDAARVVYFARDRGPPVKLLPVSIDPQPDGTLKVQRLFQVDPAEGHEAINIMVYVRGTGTLCCEHLTLGVLRRPAAP